MLRISWSVGADLNGVAELADGARFVVARRMSLPERRPVAVEDVGGSTYVFLRLPYVSDPALVVTATAGHPVLHRGQRANGAIVELTSPSGESTTPAPEQRLSVIAPSSRVELRFPDLTVAAVLDFDDAPAPDHGTGTVQLGVEALEHDDAWLVAALAVALSPDNGVVGHATLKSAFAQWRGQLEQSVGTFDRNVLRPALESRGVAEPGPRQNKIALLVDRCRRTHEFPTWLVDQVHVRLDASSRPA